jgi:hypothetical protein
MFFVSLTGNRYTIHYKVPANTPFRVSVQIVNVEGGITRTLVNGTAAGGSYDVKFDGRDNNGRTVLLR